MILGFLVTALYVPGIAAAATVPKWGLLAIVLPLMLLRPAKFTAAHLFGALFMAWCALSLIWTPNKLDGSGELIKYTILAMAFMWGTRVDLALVVRGMALGLLPSSVVVLLQYFGWYDIVLHYSPYTGLFINSGVLGEIAALVLIGLVYTVEWPLRRWWCDPTRQRKLVVSGSSNPWSVVTLIFCLLPCIILPESRSAFVAIAAAFTAWVWGRSKLTALALIALTVICITYSLHLGFHSVSTTQRIDMWRDTIGGMTWLGHGIGSFWTDYAPLATAVDIFVERPEHLHNDFLEIAFEGGLVGASLFACCIVAAWRIRGQLLSKIILIGLATQSLVDFPLHNPCTAFLAAVCLGDLVADRRSLRSMLSIWRIRLQAGNVLHRRQRTDCVVAGEREGLPA